MKNKFLQLMYLLMSGILLVMLPCCTKNDNGGNNASGGGNSGENSEPQSTYPWDGYQPTSSDIQLENKLLNTSWNFLKSVHYHHDGTLQHTDTPPFNSSFGNTYVELSYRNGHSLYINGQKKGSWWIKNGELYWTYYSFTNPPDFEITAMERGELAGLLGAHSSDTYSSVTITTLTETSFIMRKTQIEGSNSGDYTVYYYTRSSGGGGGGGGNSSYELPDVGFYDFDAGLYSLIVKYKIYNNSDAHVSSAKVYYGTTSNPTSRVNATISGTIITAHITGLSSGTEYYVKCEATGPGGTTMTSVTKLMTEFP